MSHAIRTFTALATAILLSLLITSTAQAVTYPTLVGHRGIGDPWTVELNIPEESVPAIKWAAANHADVVEGDVQVTRDGQMVMMHDETIDRTTNRTGRVIDRDLSYITGAWLEIPVDRNGNGDFDDTTYHPPSLHYWLTEAKKTGKIVFIELKISANWSQPMVKKYVDEVNALGMKDRVITAGSETRLSYFKSYSSGQRSWAISDYPSATKAKSVAQYGTISLAAAEANPDYVANMQTAGVKVFIYTLDGADQYQRALTFGAYGWMCDNTNDAWTWLQGHGA
jgi:glycerophosphoryl diester phosphodiesterase